MRQYVLLKCEFFINLKIRYLKIQNSSQNRESSPLCSALGYLEKAEGHRRLESG